MHAQGVQVGGLACRAVQGAGLVISAVTASQAVPVAEACAPALQPGAYVLDLNSTSPGAKQRGGASSMRRAAATWKAR